jgi:uncharacterized Zn finger protein (UPF0148 family)
MAHLRTRRPNPKTRPHLHRHDRPQPTPRRTQRHGLRRRRHRPHRPQDTPALGRDHRRKALRPPTSRTRDGLARWLRVNVDAIARIDLAKKGRHPLYDDIAKLVGTNQRGGQLVSAINRTEKHAAGPCPTITGRHRDGTPRQCGEMLFADTYDKTTTCPTCKQDIDVEKNRRQAAADRDLHAKADLVEVLANIDEPVAEHQVDLWITARRLRPRGYQHDGGIVEFRISDKDEPVYSVERARRLRRRDNNLRQRRRVTHA